MGGDSPTVFFNFNETKDASLSSLPLYMVLNINTMPISTFSQFWNLRYQRQKKVK